MRRLSATLLTLSLLLTVSVASPARAADPAGDFTKHFGEWKTILSRLRELQVKYNAAGDADKPALRKQYDDLITEGNGLLEKLTAAAEQAYQAKPDNDGEPAEFLATAAMRAYSREDYETAYYWLKMLLEKDFARMPVLVPAGAAAFCTHDFALADKWFKLAAQKKQFAEKEDKQQAEKAFSAATAKYKQYWEKEQELRAAEAKADDLPRVKLQTSQGDIVLELFENEAPNTVANFISLVEKKFYDGTIFHRVIPQFMAQGGDPLGKGTGGPGYRIPCECTKPGHRMHFRGTISMAHSGPDTGGSQFFLTFVPTAHLNDKHTAFGRVVEGMDVLAKLQRTEPNRPTGPLDKIVSATVVRKRDHEYVPKKVGE